MAQILTEWRLENGDQAQSGIMQWCCRHVIDPIRLLVTVCRLNKKHYQQAVFEGNGVINSATFPALTLTAHQILNAVL